MGLDHDVALGVLSTIDPPSEPTWKRLGDFDQRIAPYPSEWPLPGDHFLAFTEEDRPRLCTLMTFVVPLEPDPFPRISIWSRRRG